jgi:hypothetical protein
MQMRIDAAILDQNLLGAGLVVPETWRPWLSILKATFGLALSADEHSMPSGYRCLIRSRYVVVTSDVRVLLRSWPLFLGLLTRLSVVASQ